MGKAPDPGRRLGLGSPCGPLGESSPEGPLGLEGGSVRSGGRIRTLLAGGTWSLISLGSL